MDVELKPDGSYVWETIVKETTAAKSKPQVMHFPSIIASSALGDKQTKISVGTTTGQSFSCNIITYPNRRSCKYLSKEWGQFVKRNNLEVGDKLIFNLAKPPTNLMIKIIRHKGHN
ncbi:hypothetical protein P8452_61613 [Trifolium repens]|nr:hypothetical protein P8452_61613 [Trifolium repens]